jgi:hypothetical protein
MSLPSLSSLISRTERALSDATNAYDSWCSELDVLYANKNLLNDYIAFLEQYRGEIESEIYDELENVSDTLFDDTQHTCSGQLIEEYVSNCDCEDTPTRLRSLIVTYEDEVDYILEQANASLTETEQTISTYEDNRDSAAFEARRLQNQLNVLNTAQSAGETVEEILEYFNIRI